MNHLLCGERDHRGLLSSRARDNRARPRAENLAGVRDAPVSRQRPRATTSEKEPHLSLG
jgi:hypothetical protein